MIDLANSTHDPGAASITPRWKRGGILDVEVLEGLYDINRTYLGVLALEPPAVDAEAGMTAGSEATLARADGPVRSVLARSPFSLFNVRFEDGTFWSAQLKATSVSEPVQRYLAFHVPESDLAAFTEVALFYAWHLVQSHAPAARILLGMSKSTIKVFRRLSLHQVQRLAGEQGQRVTLRWSDHTAFWNNLLQAVQSNATSRTEDLGLLGIQMIASEVASQEWR